MQMSVQEGTAQYSFVPVRQGPLDVYVYGSGSVAAASQPVVYLQTEGKMTDLRVSVGDRVQKGQILAVLQNEALNDEIASLELDLWNADNTITITPPGGSVSSIQAPSAGRVMEISAAVGDDALAVYRRLGSVAMLSTDGRLKVALDVPDHVSLTYGETVEVVGPGFSLEGCVTDLFLQGTRAVITVMDDSLPLGAQVEVSAAGVGVGRGKLEINKPMAVSAFGGTVADVRVSRTHQCDNRIVSLRQPHVRPIVRGKAGRPFEFGQKLALSVVKGYTFVERQSFENFHEGITLIESVERYRALYGCFPEVVQADQIYRNRTNLAFCKEHGIRLSGPKLGRPAKNAERDRETEARDYKERIIIEGRNGMAKRRFGLDLIMATLPETSMTEAALQVFSMNVRIRLLWRLFFLSRFLSSVSS